MSSEWEALAGLGLDDLTDALEREQNRREYCSWEGWPFNRPFADERPVYHKGVGVWWTGYGMFNEWPSASMRIWHYVDDEDVAAEHQQIAKWLSDQKARRASRALADQTKGGET